MHITPRMGRRGKDSSTVEKECSKPSADSYGDYIQATGYVYQTKKSKGFLT